MKKLNVGCGRDIKKGWDNLDNHDSNGANIIFDLNDLYKGKKMPFKDKTFDYILIKGVLHIFINPIPILNELVRICKVNGIIDVHTYMPNNIPSINFKRGYTKTILINYSRNVNSRESPYSLERFEKSKLEVVECKYQGSRRIKKLMCSLFNLLPYRLVEGTFLMYLSPLSVRVVYKKMKV
jgi:SAM-dependent methyltransferase